MHKNFCVGLEINPEFLMPYLRKNIFLRMWKIHAIFIMFRVIKRCWNAKMRNSAHDPITAKIWKCHPCMIHIQNTTFKLTIVNRAFSYVGNNHIHIHKNLNNKHLIFSSMKSKNLRFFSKIQFSKYYLKTMFSFCQNNGYNSLIPETRISKYQNIFIFKK